MSAAFIATCLMLTPAAGLGCSSAGPGSGDTDASQRPAEEPAPDGRASKPANHRGEENNGDTGSGSGERQSVKGENTGDPAPKDNAGKDEDEPPAGSGDDALAVVDRDHGLSEDYAPEDLEPLSEHGIPTTGGREMKLRDEAAEALSALIGDANAEGVELVVGSAYRSYDHQVVSYGNWTAVHGEEGSGFSAPPGHSEHQLGTVADFTNAGAGYELGQWFGETGAADWLRQNAARYGFIMSYPRDAQQETGYRWEPWHYRYIGRENALRYKNGNYENPRRFLLEEGVRPAGAEDQEMQPASSEPQNRERLHEAPGPQGGG